MAKFSNDQETLDILNNLLGDFCIKNAKTYDTEIILNLRSTFKEVADFYNAFKSFGKQYNFKKENSPDFENALRMWITEIKIKVEIEKAEHKLYNPDNPQPYIFSLVSNVYWKTVTVKDDNIFKIHHNLFSSEYPDRQSRSTQEYIYKLLEPKLFEIATGYVYAYKLPQLEKELSELSKLKIDSKPVENISQIDLINIKSKILVLRELGIIDLLNQRFNSNNTKIADCIGAIINEKPASIRGILSNINGKKNNNTNPENIASLENAITVLNDLGCSNEVVNLQNKLGKLI